MRPLERVVVGRPRMPAVGAASLPQRVRVLHEGDAPALDRPGDERLRSFRLGAERREGLPQRAVVVAVAGASEPAEGPQLRLEVAEREDLLGRLVRLELVAVDDDREAPEPVRRGGLERFPVLALLELAVPDHHDDAASPSEPALRQGDAAALGDAHAERAGVGFDPGHADIGMPVEPAEPPQSQKPFARDDSEREERRVEARGRRAPSRRRTRPDRDPRNRPRRRSAPRTGGATRRRAR